MRNDTKKILKKTYFIWVNVFPSPIGFLSNV